MEQTIISTYKDITNLHIAISKIITPKKYRELKGKVEFAKANYMRDMQLKYFPTASWEMEERPIYNANKLVEWNVTGKLTWDYGIIGYPQITRVGMVGASHTIQYISDKYTGEKTDRLMDLGNDNKASNTDTWKKALNLYLNICDDVYRWKTSLITNENKQFLIELLKQLDDKVSYKIAMLDTLNNGGPNENLINTESFEFWKNKIKTDLKD